MRTEGPAWAWRGLWARLFPSTPGPAYAELADWVLGAPLDTAEPQPWTETLGLNSTGKCGHTGPQEAGPLLLATVLVTGLGQPPPPWGLHVPFCPARWTPRCKTPVALALIPPPPAESLSSLAGCRFVTAHSVNTRAAGQPEMGRGDPAGRPFHPQGLTAPGTLEFVTSRGSVWEGIEGPGLLGELPQGGPI